MLCGALLTAAAGCATAPPADDSVVPGTIGIAVAGGPRGVVVTAVRKDSPAAAAGVRVGDVVLSYNGAAVTSWRLFERLVLDSRPGSVARMELRRDTGQRFFIELPVEELTTSLRA